MKPWHSKEWKEMRNKIIGDSCEQCGSTKKPMVLQHFDHYKDLPKKPSKSSVVWSLMLEREAFPPRPIVLRPACPDCKKRALSQRKTMKPIWRCIGCHHVFDNPSSVEVAVDRRTGTEQFESFRKQCKVAFSEFLDSHIELVSERLNVKLKEYEKVKEASLSLYMSGEGTATFCKKCAYLWDVQGLKLCGFCRKGYHPFKYNSCFKCIPEWRKKEIAETKKFMEEMEARDRWLENAYDDTADED